MLSTAEPELLQAPTTIPTADNDTASRLKLNMYIKRHPPGEPFHDEALPSFNSGSRWERYANILAVSGATSHANLSVHPEMQPDRSRGIAITHLAPSLNVTAPRALVSHRTDYGGSWMTGAGLAAWVSPSRGCCFVLPVM